MGIAYDMGVVFLVILEQNRVFGRSAKCYMRRKSNTANASRNTIPIINTGTGSIILLGYFSSTGTGKPFKGEGRMNGN